MQGSSIVGCKHALLEKQGHGSSGQGSGSRGGSTRAPNRPAPTTHAPVGIQYVLRHVRRRAGQVLKQRQGFVALHAGWEPAAAVMRRRGRGHSRWRRWRAQGAAGPAAASDGQRPSCCAP